jgi:hypothetical protein
MDVQSLLFERRLTASLLILSFVTFLVAGYLFTARVIWKLPTAQTELHLRWERGFVIGAFLINVLGFVLLENLLRNAGDAIFARLALTIYLVSLVVMVVAETTFLNNHEWVYPQFVVHVVLGLVAPWAGWATFVWNLALLVIMPIAYPHDIYFPWLHYVAPLIIGIALLLRGS